MDIPEPDPPSPPDAESGEASSGASGRPWLQILSNYATIVIAMSAVILSVWEGCEMRKHNRLSVLLHLDVTGTQLQLDRGEKLDFGRTPETLTEPTYFFQIGLENTGLGPAVIKKGLLFRAGPDTLMYETTDEGDALYLSRSRALAKQIRGTFPVMGRTVNSYRQGTMLKAGKSNPFFTATIPVASVPDSVDGFPPRKIREMIGQYSFVVCYCSVYGEDCDQEHIGAQPPRNACRY